MKKSSKLAALALSAALALGIAVPAFAATDYGMGEETDKTTAAADAVVTKHLQTNEGSTVKATFTYTATGTTVATDEKGTSSESTAGLDVSIAPITLTSDGSGTTVDGTGAITFPTYTHAGVYAYTITEVQSATIVNADGKDGTMTYDSTLYLMRVYVENGDNGTTTISAVTFEKDPSATENGEKVNALEFTNTFVEKTDDDEDDDSSLTISKTVSGDMGDKTKDWTFTVTFTAPTHVPEGWTVANIAMVGDKTGTVNADGTITFTLKSDQSVTFNNVVVGTKYTVTETESGQDGYTTTGEVKTATTITDAGKNEAKIENHKDDITVTGVILNNAPFILMGSVAIAGVVLYGIAKRKLLA